MRSTPVTAKQVGRIGQYNLLREDAKAASYFLAHEQSTPGLTLYVEPGVAYFGSTQVNYAGGSSPSFTAPTTNPRIDLLGLDKTGTLVRIIGTEAASPTAPTYGGTLFMIAEVYNRVGQTTIRDTSTLAGSTQGYILKDARGFIQVLNVYGELGDGSDGDVTISSPTTLVRDMHYNNLTVNSTLNLDGYRIWVRGKLDGTGTIKAPDGNNGNNASAGSGGGGGAQSGSGPYKNAPGVAGGNETGGGNSGQTGRIGIAAPNGGQGGGPGAVPGAGSGGSVVSTYKFGLEAWLTYNLWDIVSGVFTVRQPAGSGAGGGGSKNGGTAGGGGGSGASGGVPFIIAREIGGTLTIMAIGGNGGNGGNASGSSVSAGGGGGGSGGNGGFPVVIYASKTGTITYVLTPGTAGSAGSGVGSSGGGAQNGNPGNAGQAYELDIRSLLR